MNNEVLKFVLMTEKCVRMIETENKLVFIVDRKATKKQIADAFEKLYGAKTVSVHTTIDQKGRKKAFIKLAQPGAASDLAVKLGII
jgi:ribosomal protein uL23